MNNNIDDYLYEHFYSTLLWLRDYMGFNHADTESQGEGNGDNMNNTERETSTTPNESL